jgi:hypothetical protein
MESPALILMNAHPIAVMRVLSVEGIIQPAWQMVPLVQILMNVSLTTVILAWNAEVITRYFVMMMERLVALQINVRQIPVMLVVSVVVIILYLVLLMELHVLRTISAKQILVMPVLSVEEIIQPA